jgi:hypothetical protein
VTCRCASCGRDFYAEEPREGLDEEVLENDRVIDDEEALRAAEAELKKQADNEDDHRLKYIN